MTRDVFDLFPSPRDFGVTAARAPPIYAGTRFLSP
jgi:hypothetical protein